MLLIDTARVPLPPPHPGTSKVLTKMVNRAVDSAPTTTGTFSSGDYLRRSLPKFGEMGQGEALKSLVQLETYKSPFPELYLISFTVGK